MNLISLFLLALFLTVISETASLFFLTRKYFKIKPKKIPGSLLLFTGILTSTATLPYLWFVLPALIPLYSLYSIIGETTIIIGETIIYHHILRLNFKKSFTISLVCNLFSFFLGKIVL